MRKSRVSFTVCALLVFSINMEDKQFKCGQCDKRFATADNLQNHNRRHEMTINLTTKSVLSTMAPLSTPLLNKGSLSAGVIGFVDETPTPTRFIRNCEEVGLFQDLQNVNPFDEDFKKAANNTATPSGETTGFEFTFSSSVIGVPGTPSVESGHNTRYSRSKRRYSDQDTLNTPQVFPYFSSTGGCHTLTTNTASMSACLTPTPQNSLTNETLSGGLHQTPQSENSSCTVSTTSYNHVEHVSIIAYTSAISQQTNKTDVGVLGSVGKSMKVTDTSKSVPVTSKSAALGTAVEIQQQNKASSLKIRSNSKLKLNLKSVVVKDKFQTLPKKVASNNEQCTIEHTKQKNLSMDFASLTSEFSKKGLLERNRAAAHRSRERRKQWIYGLESRCRDLETLLAQSQAEIARLRAENDMLKAELQNQSKADLQVVAEDISIHTVSDDAIVVHEVPEKEVQQPAVQEPIVENVEPASDLMIVSPIVLPTVKAKRGRPRRGEERRVPILAVPIISNSDDTRLLPKIPILPILQVKKM